MCSCKVWAKFSSVSNRKQIPYYSRNIPEDFNSRLDDQWVCGIPFSKTWAALHAIVFHHWLSASVWGCLQMTQQHSAREVERMSHSRVCVCVWVCVTDRETEDKWVHCGVLQVHCVLPAPVPYAHSIWQSLITHEQRCYISDAWTAPAQPACLCACFTI